MGMSLKQIKYLYAIGVFKGKMGDRGKKSASTVSTKTKSESKVSTPATKSSTKPAPSTPKKKSIFSRRDTTSSKPKRLETLKKSTPKEIGKLLDRDGSVTLQAGIRSYTAHKAPVTGEIYLKSRDKSIFPGDKDWPSGRIDVLPSKTKSDKPDSSSKRREFGTRDEAEKWAQSTLADPFSRTNGLDARSPEYQSLMAYRASAYSQINGDLRKVPPSTNKHTDKIDKAFKEFAKPLTESVQVHRGVRDDFAKMLTEKFEKGELGVGSTMKDEGYLSTSLSQDIRDDFMSYSTSGMKVSFNLTIPKGNKALWMGSNSESELLVPRGSTFQITGAEKKRRKLRGSDTEEDYLEFTGEFRRDKRWG